MNVRLRPRFKEKEIENICFLTHAKKKIVSAVKHFHITWRHCQSDISNQTSGNNWSRTQQIMTLSNNTGLFSGNTWNQTRHPQMAVNAQLCADMTAERRSLKVNHVDIFKIKPWYFGCNNWREAKLQKKVHEGDMQHNVVEKKTLISLFFG